MAQFNKNTASYGNSTSTWFDVVMLADSAGNVVPPISAGTWSVNNSSNVALSNGATFAGAWEDVSKYDSIIVAAKTDANGKYIVKFSPDGVNEDSTLTRYYRTNQIEAPHRFTVTRRYVKVSFENTHSANQTYFRLQTLYGTKGILNAPLDSVLSQDYDATVVRPSDYHYEVALGRRQGANTWNKWGYNNDIDTGSSETVWSVGGRFIPMTVANTLNINSTVGNDVSGNTGAFSVVIYGIDQNRLNQTEVISLNGTSNVTTTGLWLGVNRIAIYLVGTANSNIGTITARATTGGAVQAEIPAGKGATQHAFFFTQNNHIGLADWLWINANKVGGSAPYVTISGWVTSFVSNAQYEVFRATLDTSVENTIELKPSHPFVISENSLFEIVANTTINDTVLSARFSLIEVRDVDG